mgnify:CR=1 FL=1
MVRGGTDGSSVEEFLTWLRVERGRSANTISSYRRDLSKAEEWLTSHGSGLEEAESEDLGRFVAHLQSSGESAASTARRCAALRMYFRHRVAEGARTSDPTVMLEGVRVAAGVPKPLSVDEMERVISSVPGDSPSDLRDLALLEFMFATGARVSEACGLDTGDIDRSSGVVRLFGKGSKERVVPIGDTALSAIDSYLNGGARDILVGSGGRREDRQAVFLTNRGRRLNRQKAWEIVRTAGLRAGIERELSPHSLRHTCATLMLAGGADLRIVQEMLGHASISTTQVYTKVSQEQLLEVYRSSHPRAMT